MLLVSSISSVSVPSLCLVPASNSGVHCFLKVTPFCLIEVEFRGFDGFHSLAFWLPVAAAAPGQLVLQCFLRWWSIAFRGHQAYIELPSTCWGWLGGYHQRIQVVWSVTLKSVTTNISTLKLSRVVLSSFLVGPGHCFVWHPTAMFWDVATPVLLDQGLEMGKLLVGNDNPHETSYGGFLIGGCTQWLC